MNVASVLDRKKQGPSGSLAGIRKPAALGGGCGGLRMKLRGRHFDRSITTNQSRSKDFSAATISSSALLLFTAAGKWPLLSSARAPQPACQGCARYCAVGARPARPPICSIAPCREKLVFGALNRTIEADESGQEWKQSHQRPDQGPTFGDCSGNNPSAEGDDAYRD